VSDDRRAFLDARRATSRERYDTLHAARYDASWGDVAPSHAAALTALLALTRPAGTVLDAACGTGKYWPRILASGRTVIGTDQSAGMLEQAQRKHPDVPVAAIGLQELRFDRLFDAVICVDALENVGPEDWPLVFERLVAAARPGAPLWLSVELADAAEVGLAVESARAAGHPVVEGEVHDGVGYHFYPTRERVLGWIDATGLAVVDESDGDDYWHLILRRPA
jgi:2-polyprenyl-3-methyl-5-hydroxy-6-metoxy-1,4-benzoquinol methylase